MCLISTYLMDSIQLLAEVMTEPNLEATLKPCETTIVFDWDDTLLCSTWLKEMGFNTKHPLTGSISKDLTDPCIPLSLCVKALLEKALKLGNVVIITNAMGGWVELSTALFMPEVGPLVTKIPVISAYDLYNSITSDPFMWKQHVFVDQIDGIFKRGEGFRRNVISIGDGVSEQEAMRNIPVKTHLRVISSQLS